MCVPAAALSVPNTHPSVSDTLPHAGVQRREDPQRVDGPRQRPRVDQDDLGGALYLQDHHLERPHGRLRGTPRTSLLLLLLNVIYSSKCDLFLYM